MNHESVYSAKLAELGFRLVIENYLSDKSGKHHYTCSIYYNDTHWIKSIPYTQGSAITREPTLADLLYCLSGDASAAEGADLADFLVEFSYIETPGSVREGIKAYEACLAALKSFQELPPGIREQVGDILQDF